MADTLHNPTVKGVEDLTLADTAPRVLMSAGDPAPTTAYQEVRSTSCYQAGYREATTWAELVTLQTAGTPTLVCSQLTVTSAETLDGAPIQFTPTGSLDTNGFTVKIDVTVVNPDNHQIFSNYSPGDVYGLFGNPAERYPQWWGAVADSDGLRGGTDNTDAIQAAIWSGNPAISGGPAGSHSHAGVIKLGAGNYRCGTINMRNAFCSLRGTGIFATSLYPDETLMAPGGACIEIGTYAAGWGDYGESISDMFIRFQNDCAAGFSGIKAIDDVGEPFVIERVWIAQFTAFGVQVRAPGLLCLGLSIRDCAFNSPVVGSVSIDVAYPDSFSMERCTVNPNGAVENGIIIESPVGPCTFSNLHIEDVRYGIEIRRSSTTPSQITIRDCKHEGNFDNWVDATVVLISPTTSASDQTSVIIENIKRRDQAGKAPAITIDDQGAGGMTVTESNVNQFRRFCRSAAPLVVLTDYTF